MRTDSFVQLGKMYGSKPGFYLLVGPGWKGEVPRGITQVFRCPTNTGLVAPRIFQDDMPDDKRAVQASVSGIMMYPLAEYDGKMRTTDWTKMPTLPSPPEGEEETKWVVPDKFADQLSMVLADAPPLPGEEARCNDYVQTELLGQGELGARAKEMRDDRLVHQVSDWCSGAAANFD